MPGVDKTVDAPFPLRRTAEAFSAFYDAHAPAVMGLCLRMLGRREEAEDAFQEAFAQAWRQADRFDPAAGAPGAWLAVIARSRCLDRLRKRRVRAGETPLEPAVLAGGTLEIPAPDVSALDVLGAAEDRERARRALAALPREQREALEAAYFEGLTQVEIAARTGTPLGTVKTRMRRGLMRLADLLS